MTLEAFKRSAALTMGVELELQIINLDSLDLQPFAQEVLKLLRGGDFPGDIKPEITQNMIEVATGIHTRHDDLLLQLEAMRSALGAVGQTLKLGFCGGGTHPFQKWSERRIFEQPRFVELSSLYGYLAKQFTIFGQHVHIGCASGDDALFLLHALNRYVPHFIALSASSPLVQGIDTHFASARLNSVFAFPLSGRAPFILEWSRFEHEFFAKMERTGIVAGMKDFYWDLRPKPEFGTIELRVCDTPLTVARAAALACYLQALCKLLLEGGEPAAVDDDYLVYNFNRFQACRFGLEGVLVHPKTQKRISLRDDIRDTLARISPHAQALGNRAGLVELERVIADEGNHASILRRLHQDTNRAEALVEHALADFARVAAP